MAFVTCLPFIRPNTTGMGIPGSNGTTAISSGLKIRTLFPASRLMPSPIWTALRMDSTLAVRRMLGVNPAWEHSLEHSW